VYALVQISVNAEHLLLVHNANKQLVQVLQVLILQYVVDMVTVLYLMFVIVTLVTMVQNVVVPFVILYKWMIQVYVLVTDNAPLQTHVHAELVGQVQNVKHLFALMYQPITLIHVGREVHALHLIHVPAELHTANHTCVNHP
jgi:hypothetical protein